MVVVPPVVLASFTVSGILAVAIPLLVGELLRRRLGVRWGVYSAGCIMFVFSLARLPLNASFSGAVERSLSGDLLRFLLIAFPSLTTAIFEELARFSAFRILIKDLSWENGVMYGAGHGGFESILMAGLNVVVTGLTLIISPAVVPPEQVQAISALPAIIPMAGLYERIMDIAINIGLSIMVLRCVARTKYVYLGLAIVIHFILNLSASYLSGFGIQWSSMIVTAFAIPLTLYAAVTRDSSQPENTELEPEMLDEKPGNVL